MKKLHFLFSGIFLWGSVFASPEVQIQLELEVPEYNESFEYAKAGVDDSKNECAKFVNRIFWSRFEKRIWGNAWDLPAREQNKEFIDVIWRIPESEFQNDSFWVNTPDERLEHFKSLYRAVDQQRYPIGIVGFLYKYSGVKEELRKSEAYFPQTHVSFLSGKKWFQIENTGNRSQTVREILEEKHGTIHEFEEDFINERLRNQKFYVGKKVSLKTQISPRSSFWYFDYLIEEQFKYSRTDSLLGSFLRKHRNNRTEGLLRPVSFARISDKLILELEKKYE